MCSDPWGSTRRIHYTHVGGFLDIILHPFSSVKFSVLNSFSKKFPPYLAMQFLYKHFRWGDPEKMGVFKWPEVLFRKQSLLSSLLEQDPLQEQLGVPLSPWCQVCFHPHPTLLLFRHQQTWSREQCLAPSKGVGPLPTGQNLAETEAYFSLAGHSTHTLSSSLNAFT